ncbi:hypothetical protein SASPL_134940 [Salvia splendens]|uniref:Uncharacterized protein n=1 Tax=Salvia splendens TaxID=180675 RepID=A0A8X8ZF82_SALSN|nr:uncharacterized protein LOC121762798 isoform X2 [Salvia splendens]KAG6402731.1 hypothetical protein SASPL_134940 [Salvia splendens]
MSAIAGESSGEIPTGNRAETNITENIPWTDYALQQAQIAQKTIESTVENAIEVTRSRVDRIVTTSSAHFNQTIDSLHYLKSEYTTYEDIAFAKIKEGFLLAYSHPLITTGVVVGVGSLGLKKTRQFLTYKTMRIFLSEETLLSRADARVKELRQSIELLKGESEKLEKRALQAEEHLVRGRTKLRQAGKQIQGAIASSYKIERQARGLKDALSEFPSREASRFRSEVTNLAKEAKKERNVLSKEVTKISNHGISV